MNAETETILLAAIARAVEQEPTFFRDVVLACNEGVIRSRQNAYARACDMETAVVSLLEMQKKGQRNKKGHRDLAISMLERHRDETAIAWKAYEEYFPELKKEAANAKS